MGNRFRWFVACLGFGAILSFAVLAAPLQVEPFEKASIVYSLDVPMHAVIPDCCDVAQVTKRDSYSRAFAVNNQPDQPWRLAVDAYRHIDPGRRSL